MEEADTIDDVISLLQQCMQKAMGAHQNRGITNPKKLTSIMRDANALGYPHVSGIYSPPRVTSLAAMLGLRPGMAFDLTLVDEDDGLPWDFGKEDKKKPNQS